MVARVYRDKIGRTGGAYYSERLQTLRLDGFMRCGCLFSAVVLFILHRALHAPPSTSQPPQPPYPKAVYNILARPEHNSILYYIILYHMHTYTVASFSHMHAHSRAHIHCTCTRTSSMKRNNNIL